MKRILIVCSMLITATILSACGQEAAPTTAAVDMQNTAVAAAFTLVAQTEAAIPTATPMPPTETPTQTPLPTETPVPLPSITSTSVNTSSTSCNGLISSSTAGRPTTIRIINKSKFDHVRVSLYLNLTPFGECGWAVIPELPKGGDFVLSSVQGPYSIWAWTDDGKLNVSGGGTINNPDKWTFEITPSIIKFVGP